MIEQQQVREKMIQYQKTIVTSFFREELLQHHPCLQAEEVFLMQEQGHLKEEEHQHQSCHGTPPTTHR